MDELLEKAREEESSSDSDEELTDWAEIGRVLGYVVGGILAWNTKKYDEVFKDAEEEVQALIKNVTETLAECMWLSGFPSRSVVRKTFSPT